MREDGGDVRPGQKICRPDMQDGSQAGTLSMARPPFGGWVYETVRASEKRKAGRKSDGGKANRPDQEQARPLREMEPW